MGITRTVTTQVYCDVCGKWVIGWESEETGVSREWAKYHARCKGCTAGQAACITTDTGSVRGWQQWQP